LLEEAKRQLLAEKEKFELTRADEKEKLTQIYLENQRKQANQKKQTEEQKEKDAIDMKN